ncbi:MAG: sugar phosphate nucleotidyltransferase [Anaerolineales bacterium]|nr:sugar phosphate nucleotidyltransferase [Anaerolineales bacterium]MCS7247446.1 sugar phosphate nucleotidyltransferase [Anaerolineales bacterium]MDW8161257.1 sugar phosphate nucleotidyltransferase [Anaerolineales bacterium]MDW8448282.1 sugar phosphate nucleotidyltransferase [Anaerolineales bacterium]
MQKKTLKIVIPMAGLGTRLRPLTYSKPKQLVTLAGKAVLDHVLDTLSGIPDCYEIELVNIVGYLGEQIEAHISKHYPHLRAHYVVQDDPRGQSHAIYLARHLLDGPMLVIFADTLIRTDLSCLLTEKEAIAWVKPVADPRRFGVAELDQNGYVRRLVEKPQDFVNNLAVVGFYYFKEAKQLVEAIEEQMRRGIAIKGEYFLADAINILLERGLKMSTQTVEVWLDAGTPEALLEANRYLLENGADNSQEARMRSDVVIVPPVFIHPTAEVKYSVIGPHASLAEGCRVHRSVIRDSILAEAAEVTDAILESSLIGRKAQIKRRPGVINAGDQTSVSF